MTLNALVPGKSNGGLMATKALAFMREIGADEIRAQLRNEQIMDQLRESREVLESTARELQRPLEQSLAEPAPEPRTGRDGLPPA